MIAILIIAALMPRAGTVVDQLNGGASSNMERLIRRMCALTLRDAGLRDGRMPYGCFRGRNDPNLASCLREVERLGPEALPGLVEHISDSRSTKVIVTEREGALIGTTALYDAAHAPRFLTPTLTADMYLGLPSIAGARYCRLPARYTLKVGDICFHEIGIIVGRELCVLDPGSKWPCVSFVNSPVLQPKLAEAVRRDWQAPSAQIARHLERSCADQLDPLPAIQRLVTYYPGRVAITLKRLLARHLYESIPSTILGPTASVQVDLARLQRTDPELYSCVPYWIAYDRYYSSWRPEARQRLLNGFDPLDCERIHEMYAKEQADIMALFDLKPPAGLNRAAYRVLKNALSNLRTGPGRPTFARIAVEAFVWLRKSPIRKEAWRVLASCERKVSAHYEYLVRLGMDPGCLRAMRDLLRDRRPGPTWRPLLGKAG